MDYFVLEHNTSIYIMVTHRTKTNTSLTFLFSLLCACSVHALFVSCSFAALCVLFSCCCSALFLLCSCLSRSLCPFPAFSLILFLVLYLVSRNRILYLLRRQGLKHFFRNLNVSFKQKMFTIFRENNRLPFCLQYSCFSNLPSTG